MSFSTSVHQPNVDQNIDAPSNPQDNYWDSATCQNAIEIVDRRCTALIYKKDGKGFCSALAKHPILLNKNCSGICYFEILIVNMKSMVTIGFAPKQFTISQSDERIFNCADTYAYESGGNFWINGRGQRGKSEFTFQVGDIVGCGINLDTRQIFFTQNKWDFGDIAFLSMCPSVVPLFPFVSLMDSGDKIVAKFKPKFIINLASLKFNPVERQQNSGTIPNEEEAVIDGEHTPLWTAVVDGQTKLLEFLLENGADPNENLKLAYKGQNRNFSPLHYASIKGNLETFKVLMENGANVKQKTADEFGTMPLHFACSEGHLEIVKLLVEKVGADIEIAKTALMVACSLQKWDIVRYLIGKGAKVDRTNAKGISPLHLACVYGHLEIVKLLVEVGKADIDKADSVIGWSPLMVVSFTEKWDIVRYLIEKGANIDQTDNNEGFSIIHSFAIHGHFDLCKLMLDKGINVNKQMHNRTTPLHLACKHGHLEIVKLLVEEGKADIESADDNRHTPLMIALCGHQLEIAYYLVEKGAKVDQSADFIGNTPFLYAIYMKSLSLCKLMVKVANVNLRMADHGFTPLQLACEVGHLGIVKLLVEEGKADIESADSYGKTALMVACSFQKCDIVRYLIGKGAKVDRTDAKGISPLHLECIDGHLEIVKLLVEVGKADIESRDSYGNAPLMIASKKRKFDIAYYLIEKGAKVDRANAKGNSPLHPACHVGHMDIVKLLVEVGKADIEKAEADSVIGWSPLMVASNIQKWDIFRYLIEKGANTDHTDNNGLSIIHYLVDNNNFDECKFLIDKGVNVNQKTADNLLRSTPLHLACEAGNLEIVKLLVEEGKADIEIANSDGDTALKLAKAKKKDDVVHYLVEKGAKNN